MPNPITPPASSEFSLQNGDRVSVSALHPWDATEVQQVLATTFDDTYVVPGWWSLQSRKQLVDPENTALVERQAARIHKGREDLANGDKNGALYLGAFAANRLVGIAKTSSYEAMTLPGRIWHKLTDRLFNRSIGYIDEIDVLPEWQHLGIGKCLALLALKHAQNVGFTEVRLHVTHGNEQAKSFYLKHLAMKAIGFITPSPADTKNRAMSRNLMVANTQKALNTLLKLNPWLNAQS